MRHFIAATALIGCASLQAQHPWQPDEFPIACWRGPPRSHNTLEHYKRLRAANFTVTGPTGGHTTESNRRALDLCRATGLKAILVDERLGPETGLGDNTAALVAQVVADYADHPALYGYHLRDEPSSLLFEPLGKITAELLREDPAHLPYVNLLPTYANSQQLGTPTYREHLERFVRDTRPRLLS